MKRTPVVECNKIIVDAPGEEEQTVYVPEDRLAEVIYLPFTADTPIVEAVPDERALVPVREDIHYLLSSRQRQPWDYNTLGIEWKQDGEQEDGSIKPFS